MTLRKSILTSLLLAVMGLFLAGCGCSGGQCPFKKMFGAKPKATCPPAETTPAPCPATK